jgi:hypothetical protein
MRGWVRVDGPSPVTRLSRRPARGLGFAPVSRLARPSLLLLATMFVSSGCIVADPPEYRSAVRTRPLLEVYKASPSTTDIVVWTQASAPMGAGITFTIPVRSEDAGEDLSAVSFIDYGTGQSARPYKSQRYPASTYDQTRNIEFLWLPTSTSTDGCHVFTIIVAHQSSFKNQDTNQLIPERAGDDASIVSWWTNINPPNSEFNTLRNCPQAELPSL